MERKAFLRNSIGLLSVVTILDACKKTETEAAASSTTSSGTATTANGQTAGCYEAPTEVEGPYPYPGGEYSSPLQRSNIVESKTGVPLSLALKVVNINSSCADVNGARVDIWHCDKDGYYSGYANQTSINGTQSTVGQTFLRGWQLTGTDGIANFATIYPGWYSGRATHIHFEVYIGSVLKKTGQFTFNDTISDAVHTSTLYAAHGVNTMRASADGIFGNSASDLAKEIASVAGSVASGYAGTFTIGIAI